MILINVFIMHVPAYMWLFEHNACNSNTSHVFHGKVFDLLFYELKITGLIACALNIISKNTYLNAVY